MKEFILEHPKDKITPIVRKRYEYLLIQIQRSINVEHVGKKQLEDYKKEAKERVQTQEKQTYIPKM